jgi:hypothetical protein
VDNDLDSMSRDQLLAEVKKLRAGIRRHRDSSGHDLCWYHPELWSLVPEKTQQALAVPEWSEFMQGCVRYRQSIDQQCPQAPRTSESHDS